MKKIVVFEHAEDAEIHHNIERTYSPGATSAPRILTRLTGIFRSAIARTIAPADGDSAQICRERCERDKHQETPVPPSIEKIACGDDEKVAPDNAPVESIPVQQKHDRQEYRELNGIEQHFKKIQRLTDPSQRAISIMSLTEINDHTFITYSGGGEYGAGLGQMRGLVGVGFGEMAEQQVAYMGVGGDAGSLGGRGMVALAGAYGSLVGIGCLMIEPVDTFDLPGERGGEHRVGAVGIAYGRIGRGGKHVVCENTAIGSGIISPTLDVVEFRYRNIKEFHHIAAQMAGFWLLAEDVAHAGNTVAQRYCLDRESRQVEHCLAPCGVYHVELQVERTLAAEKIHYLAENLHSVGKGMDRHGASLVLKGKC